MIFSEIKEYVRQNDVGMVRKEMLAILNSNPDMRDGNFAENLHYVENELGEDILYQKYSGEFEIESDRTQWNTNYVAKIFLCLRKEFSKELVYHLIEVAPVAYKELADKKEQSDADFHKNIQNNDAFANLPTGVKYMAVIVLILLFIILMIKIFK